MVDTVERQLRGVGKLEVSHQQLVVSFSGTTLDLLPPAPFLPDPDVQQVPDQRGLHLPAQHLAPDQVDIFHGDPDEYHRFLDPEEEAPHIGTRRADDAALFVHPLPDRQYRARGPGDIAVAHARELGIGLPVHGAERALHERLGEAVEVPHRRRGLVGGDPHHGPDAQLHRHT